MSNVTKVYGSKICVCAYGFYSAVTQAHLWVEWRTTVCRVYGSGYNKEKNVDFRPVEQLITRELTTNPILA